jgi:hypothetical protein
MKDPEKIYLEIPLNPELLKLISADSQAHYRDPVNQILYILEERYRKKDN